MSRSPQRRDEETATGERQPEDRVDAGETHDFVRAGDYTPAVRPGLLLMVILIGALDAAAQTKAPSVAETQECGGCAELAQYWQQMYEQGHLRGTLVEATLPGAFGGPRLITPSWFLLIPELNRKFPGKSMRAEGVVVTPPVVACDLTRAEVTALVELRFWVLLDSGDQIAFAVRTPYAWSSRTRLDPRFPFRSQGSSTSWSVSETAIGSINPAGNLQDIFSGFLQWLRAAEH